MFSTFGSPTVTNCLFINNTSAIGGAYYQSYGLVEMSHCTFVGNTATQNGGALVLENTTGDSINNCTFYGNEAPIGGSVSVLYMGESEVNISNCIITGSLEGEALFNDDTGVINISQTNIYGNAGGDWVGIIADQLGSNYNISLDPQFCGAGDGDFTLWFESPCLATNNPGGELMGAWGVGCGDVSLIPVNVPEVAFNLSTYPNPFNPSTLINFSLPRAQRVNLMVFDLQGKQVANLANRVFVEGPHGVPWHGRDNDGNLVASGPYLVRLVSEDQTIGRKIMLLK